MVHFNNRSEGGGATVVTHVSLLLHCSLYPFLRNISQIKTFYNYGCYSNSTFEENANVLLKCENGLVQSFSCNKDTTLCIMWHPERSGLANLNTISIMRSFFHIDTPLTYKAITVLCAGQGSRLRPLTNTVPKCIARCAFVSESIFKSLLRLQILTQAEYNSFKWVINGTPMLQGQRKPQSGKRGHIF